MRNKLVTELELAALYLYQTFEVGSRPRQNNYTCELYRLIAKADFSNRYRLKKAHPTEVQLYEEWMETKDRFDFYTKYNCQINHQPGSAA